MRNVMLMVVCLFVASLTAKAQGFADWYPETDCYNSPHYILPGTLDNGHCHVYGDTLFGGYGIYGITVHSAAFAWACRSLVIITNAGYGLSGFPLYPTNTPGYVQDIETETKAASGIGTEIDDWEISDGDPNYTIRAEPQYAAC